MTVTAVAGAALAGLVAAEGARAGRAGCDGSGGSVASTERSLRSAGSERTYRLQVPPAHDGVTPLPVVLDFHGFGGTALGQEQVSGFSPLADRDGFILVHPQGLGEKPGWNSGGVFSVLVPFDDVGFVRRLIDRVSIEFCADPSRIFVTGVSNGGGMADRLGCEMPERVVAIAPVAGAYTQRPRRCSRARRVSVLELHGDADTTTPYRSGKSTWFLGVRRWLSGWARRNGCKRKAMERRIAADVTRVVHRRCARGASVRHYRVHGGGHTWFASPSTAATRRIWRFFSGRPRSGKVSFAVRVRRRGRVTFRLFARATARRGKPQARFARRFRRAGTQTVRWRPPRWVSRSAPRLYVLSYRGRGERGTVVLRLGRGAAPPASR